MRHHPDLGLAAPELGWVPSPGFVLRRAAILDRMRGWPPGRALEVGCGSGALLFDLTQRGFSAVGVESSAEALKLARTLLGQVDAIRLTDRLPDQGETFDYLFAFEVLEHVRDDRAALTEWVERLKPGGRCLLSVPAHRGRWNLTDRLAGHFRRYDRADIVPLLAAAGLIPSAIETYGFPLTWALERARRMVRFAESKWRGIETESIPLGDAAHTSASGTDRRIESRFYPLYAAGPGRWLLTAGARVQHRFRKRDWGISFLVEARK